MLKEGQAAPDLKLGDDGGLPVQLSELKGRAVVLYFYPKDDTETCTAEAAAFSRLKAAFSATGAEVIGVSPDSAKSHARFKLKHGLTVRLLADEDKSAVRAFGVWAQKTMFGRKYMGVERSTFLIDRQGKIARIWRKVRTPGHAEEVLAAANALQP